MGHARLGWSPCPGPWDPPWHKRRVPFPIGPELAVQPRLLMEGDAKMEGDHDGAEVERERPGPEVQRPSEDHGRDREVHGIADVAVQTPRHQPSRRIPWCER